MTALLPRSSELMRTGVMTTPQAWSGHSVATCTLSCGKVVEELTNFVMNVAEAEWWTSIVSSKNVK